MSEDIKPDQSGGYLVLPRRVRLAAVGAVITAVFGLGGWITVMQLGVSEAKASAKEASQDVEQVKDSVLRIEKYLCSECRAKGSAYCAEICVVRRRMRLEAR